MWSILYVFCVFQYGRLAKFSNRLIAGPSFSRPNLFCFDLVWPNHIAGKYISRNGYVPDWWMELSTVKHRVLCNYITQQINENVRPFQTIYDIFYFTSSKR